MPIPPISDDEFPQALAGKLDPFLVSANVYRTMAHHPDLLLAWGPLRQHVVVDSALAEDEREVVILRLAHRLNAQYEWTHHVVRSRTKGLTDARISSIAGPPDAMADDDALLARAVDALVDGAALPEDISAALETRGGREFLFDVIATIGFYTTLAYIVKSCDTPIDNDVLKAIEDQPLNP